MCNIEKQRITVLMGAGVPLNLESQGGFFPSTQNITNEVLDTPYKVFDIKKGTSSVGNLITEVYKRCCEEYHPEALDPTDKKSAGKVHSAHRDYDVWDHFNQLSLAGPMISDNGRLMLFIGGFKNAIEKHGDEIIQFLKS